MRQALDNAQHALVQNGMIYRQLVENPYIFFIKFSSTKYPLSKSKT
jgi:hypothetical protein